MPTAASNAIALDPTFAAATTSYTASVAWSVSTVTVTAAATDTNATVSISDDDDTTTPGTAELGLDVGANTVTVTVTAEDTTTTSTYTVTVTRSAPPAHVPRTLVGNTGQSTPAGGAPVLSIQSLAMQFTTGSSANRWSLTGVQIEVAAWQSGVAPTVSAARGIGTESGRADRHPDEPRFRHRIEDVHRTLDVGGQAPGEHGPTGSSSSPRAWSSTGSRFRATDSTAEDSGGTAGWQIADTGLTDGGQGWATGSHLLKFAVIGTADSGDATLSALTFGDADDGDIALDPAFRRGHDGVHGLGRPFGEHGDGDGGRES